MSTGRQDAPHLHDRQTLVDFYQKRYARGYMYHWPAEAKERIVEVIRSLGLPEAGEALDFGCGNGVLTGVIGQALPGWRVYGTDISTIAIESARKHGPDCTFFVAGEPEFAEKKFDFLFTHHVLEHVQDLSQALGEIDAYLKPTSAVLHILPCGNEGSFEHSICLLRKDGIDPEAENRFFFEVKEHVRRLTTEQLGKLYAARGFVLAQEYYSNHYHGGINWLTRANPGVVWSLLNVSTAVNVEARRKLKRLRYRLIGLWLLRLPANIIGRLSDKKNKVMMDYILLMGALPFYIFSKPIDSHLRNKAREEWQKRKTERNGSEMYLFYLRNNPGDGV